MRTAAAEKASGKERAEPVDLLIDLLRRVEEAEEAAEGEAGADRVAEGDAVADDDAESVEHLARLQRTAVLLVQRLRQPQEAPAVMARPKTAIATRIARQPANIRMPWPTIGARIGTAMKTIIASDMTLAILRPPIGVAHDRDGDDARRAGADALERPHREERGEAVGQRRADAGQRVDRRARRAGPAGGRSGRRAARRQAAKCRSTRYRR